MKIISIVILAITGFSSCQKLENDFVGKTDNLWVTPASTIIDLRNSNGEQGILHIPSGSVDTSFYLSYAEPEISFIYIDSLYNLPYYSAAFHPSDIQLYQTLEWEIEMSSYDWFDSNSQPLVGVNIYKIYIADFSQPELSYSNASNWQNLTPICQYTSAENFNTNVKIPITDFHSIYVITKLN